MIYVIPLGKRRPDTLRYALRSLDAHTDSPHLITIGEQPEGITPDEHWPSPNTGDPYANVSGHLQKAAERLEGEWVWMADDIFLLADWTPAVHVRSTSIAQHLSLFPAVPTYSQAIRASIKIMRSLGIDPDTTPCGAIHLPMLIDTDHLRTTLNRLAAHAVPAACFKPLYTATTPHPTSTQQDPKHSPTPLALSVNRRSWPAHRHTITQLYTQPSRWET